MLLIKVLFIKNACNVVFWFSKSEEITLPHEFLFVFVRYFIGTVFSKKSCQKRRFGKKDKKVEGIVISGVVCL